MWICLVENRSSGPLSEDAAGYVGELGPVLAESHRVSILTLDPGVLPMAVAAGRVRRMLASNPAVVHVNNLTGVALSAVLIATGDRPLRPISVVGLHDDRLLRRQVKLHRWLSRSVSLVVSPSSQLLDAHLARDFFPRARHEVIPYAMPYHAERLVEAYRRAVISRRAGDLGNRAA